MKRTNQEEQPRFLGYIEYPNMEERGIQEYVPNGGPLNGQECEGIEFRIDQDYFGTLFDEENKVEHLARDIKNLYENLLDTPLSLVKEGRMLNSDLYLVSSKEYPIICTLGIIGNPAYDMPNSKARFYDGGVSVRVLSPNSEHITSLHQHLK